MARNSSGESKATATINDVARIAGVSKRTVSRVLNDSQSVNKATREKILSVIESLDYSPSKQARGLASSRSYLLGILYDEPNAIVIHSVQRGVLSVCSSLGYELVVHPISHESPTLVTEVLKFVTRSSLDGLVIMPPISSNEELIAALRDKGIKYVRMAARVVDSTEHLVISDDRAAMQQVADLFQQKAVTHPAIIRGPDDRMASEERYEGLMAALSERGISLSPDYIADGNFSYDSGVVAAQKLLAQTPRPDAIFASNDQMAIAAIHVAEDAGIAVPDELIVVGYDDEPMASRLRPSLTTLQRDNSGMASAAALKLVANIAGKVDDAQSIQTLFTPQLVTRQSSDRRG